jgi:hypothetical protein
MNGMYEIDLDGFCEEIFHKMEEIQDGTAGHVVQFKGADKKECVENICNNLKSFIHSQLKEV